MARDGKLSGQLQNIILRSTFWNKGLLAKTILTLQVQVLCIVYDEFSFLNSAEGLILAQFF